MNTYTRIILSVLVLIAIGVGIFVMRQPGGKTPVVTPDPTVSVYTNSAMKFSIQYPVDFISDTSYVYQGFGPAKNISGVSFTIPTTTSQGTNLSRDSRVSVEYVPQGQVCNASLFLGQGSVSETVTDGGVTYSVSRSSDAGAGNRYEETVYALPGTHPCIAVRYFVHYGAYENYPKDAVREFNKSELIRMFGDIRRTLRVY